MFFNGKTTSDIFESSDVSSSDDDSDYVMPPILDAVNIKSPNNSNKINTTHPNNAEDVPIELRLVEYNNYGMSHRTIADATKSANYIYKVVNDPSIKANAVVIVECFQPITYNSLVETFGSDWSFSPHVPPENMFMGSGVVIGVKNTFGSIRDIKTTTFAACCQADCLAEKGASLLTIQLKQSSTADQKTPTNKQVCIVATHLQSLIIPVLCQLNLRDGQIQQISDMISDARRDNIIRKEDVVVITGDFNDLDLGHHYNSSSARHGKAVGHHATIMNANMVQTKENVSCATNAFGCLDLVYIQKTKNEQQTKKHSASRVEIVTIPGNVSDHEPIFTTVIL